MNQFHIVPRDGLARKTVSRNRERVLLPLTVVLEVLTLEGGSSANGCLRYSKRYSVYLSKITDRRNVEHA